ncbi:unnamed protein product [Brachionus calyciflorus]|uniref:Uncharacterized protein n=1 Tax=Brachionus calyciflorus TaxID=104777 RepID=A0A814DEE4_9BILA|nr:unnamed protein product [Brachionus calyciflorus]
MSNSLETILFITDSATCHTKTKVKKFSDVGWFGANLIKKDFRSKWLDWYLNDEKFTPKVEICGLLVIKMLLSGFQKFGQVSKISKLEMALNIVVFLDTNLDGLLEYQANKYHFVLIKRLRPNVKLMIMLTRITI